MKKTLASIAALSLLAIPLSAGAIGYASGQSCTISADVVTCAPSAGRGSLCVESAETTFVKYRDALTTDWVDAVTPVPCNDCMVSMGITGCATEADSVALTRKSLALIRHACYIRQIVINSDVKDAVETATGTVDTDPDIGGGDPG